MPGSTPPPTRSLSPEAALTLIPRVLALALLTGIILSFPLWSEPRTYPKVPFFFDWQLPPLGEQTLLLLLVLAAASLAFTGLHRGLASWSTVATGTVLILFDQTRLQPWIYVYLMFLVVLALPASPKQKVTVLRWMLAAIYFWSGAQKVHVAFSVSIFPHMLHGLTGLLPADLAPKLGIYAALFEAAWGLLLLGSNKLRRVGAGALILMHLFILLLLGPLGISFNSVVWPWNVFMALLLAVVFFAVPDQDERPSWYFALPLLLMWLAPLLSFFNKWDAYLSFALYSPRTLLAALQIDQSEEDKLPPYLLRIATPAFRDHRREVPIQSWTYGELNTPPNPERRIYQAVGREVCRRIPALTSLTLAITEKPNWITGNAETIRYSCRDLESGATIPVKELR